MEVVLSRDRRSLTAPRSRASISLPWWPVHVCVSVCLAVSGGIRGGGSLAGGEASLATSAEVEPRGEEEKASVPSPLHPSSFLNLSRAFSICPTSGRPQSSSSLDTLVAMSLKANGAPQRRLNLTPLLWPSPLGSWQTSASKATRAPAAPWVQDRRKGPARWTWQPYPCAASRSASTNSAGSRGLRTLTSQPHRGVRGSAAF